MIRFHGRALAELEKAERAHAGRDGSRWGDRYIYPAARDAWRVKINVRNDSGVIDAYDVYFPPSVPMDKIRKARDLIVVGIRDGMFADAHAVRRGIAQARGMVMGNFQGEARER